MPEYSYDVAISFAGPERDWARKLAEILEGQYVRVFFDEFERANLWGKDLVIYFDDLYQRKARFCLVIISQAYAERDWTRHELGAALNRAFRQKGEYILPIRVDDTKIPGLRESLGYIDAREFSLEEIAKFVVQKLIADTRGAVEGQVQLESVGEDTPKLTPEDPEDSQELLSLWEQFSSHPEQKAVRDNECAWVIPWRNGGVSMDELELVYDEDQEKRYDVVLPDLAQKALDKWGQRNPDIYERLSKDPWGTLVRFEGLEFIHGAYKFRVHLSPIKYLYYVAIQARLWSHELQALRRLAFKNALTLDLEKRNVPLMLPSNFAIHMGVVSQDGFVLLRQRTEYTELFPSAWEVGIGEFMHGNIREIHTVFPHFSEYGQPDLYLFLKNAVAEELNYNHAGPEDFSIYGFAVESRTLAPKLLVVYRSDVGIGVLMRGARKAKDRSPNTDRVELSPAGIARIIADPKYPTWGPTSKLVMMLALTQGMESTQRNNIIEEVSEWVGFFAQRLRRND